MAGEEAFDLVILGGGPAGFAAAVRAHELGARVAMVNDGHLGGACYHGGCVPSKALVRASQAHHRANRSPFAGLRSGSELVDFAALVRQRDELLAGLRRREYEEVLAGLPRLSYFCGRGRLRGRTAVEVTADSGEGRLLRAERVLIATGASPRLPALPGLDGVGCLTSAEALSLTELPEALLVLGGGYVAAELGQAFARLGSRVTILTRGEQFLSGQPVDVAEALAGFFREEGVDIVTGVEALAVERRGGRVVLRARVAGEEAEFAGSHLLVATGRRPNTDDLGLEEAGVERAPGGGVAVDDKLETSAPGVFAAGDAIRPLFVYLAAYEGALAAENALGSRRRPREDGPLPWVIFTDPQASGVGMDVDEARQAGFDAEAVTLPLERVAGTLVAREARGFVRLVRDRASDRLLGARLVAPEGGELVAELTLAIRHGLTTAELAASFHPYLTRSEAVRLAALQFRKDVAHLSRCAG